MIAARDVVAIYRIEDGYYVGCEVVAWSDSGLAMCIDRHGALAPAKMCHGFVALLVGTPGGDKPDDYEQWFRRSIGLADDAPLTMHPAEGRRSPFARAYMLCPTLPAE